MAHSELSGALINNRMYEEALEAGQTSLSIYQKSPGYLNGSYWPTFAIVHQALALLALKRGQEATGMLRETLQRRVDAYGVNDTESFKLGYVLQILGNILVQEAGWIETFDLYQRELNNFKDTVGVNYHRSGHVCVKTADHHAQMQQYETAGIYLKQALRSFGSHPYYNPKIARANFKKAQLLEIQGDKTASRNIMDKVDTMYNDILPRHKRGEKPLTATDLDDIVFMWSR